jgi:hypothetical protein
VTLTTDAANLYRLEAELDGALSAPVDVEAPTMAVDGPSIFVASPAYASCLTMSPGAVDDRGDVKIGQTDPFAIQLQNGCGEDLTADDIHLVSGTTGFTVSTTAPLTIPAGQLRAVSLAFAPTGAPLVEDILVIHLGGSAPGFLVVSVRGAGTP